MNCIITEPVMRKIWPDYGNYVDNSWKIMEGIAVNREMCT